MSNQPSGLLAVHLAAAGDSVSVNPAVTISGSGGEGAPPAAQPAPIATAAELASTYPGLCASIAASAATAERERILGIERISAGVDPKLVTEMKSDPAVTPEKAAMRILETAQQARGAHLASIQNVETVTAVVNPAPSANPGGQPAKLDAHQIAARARAYQDEQAKLGIKMSVAQAVIHVEKHG